VKILSAFSPFGPPKYIGEKSTALGRPYGTKVTCHWKHLWEHIQYFTSPLRTFGEHIGNNKAPNNPTLLTPSPKKKK